MHDSSISLFHSSLFALSPLICTNTFTLHPHPFYSEASSPTSSSAAAASRSRSSSSEVHLPRRSSVRLSSRVIRTTYSEGKRDTQIIAWAKDIERKKERRRRAGKFFQCF